jgi:predicted nucleic acid-binding protein
VRERVLDASIAAKWFFPETYSDRATRLLSSRGALLAPDLIIPELANVVWKRCRLGEISAEQANGIVRDVARMPLTIIPSASIISAALDLAIQTRRTVYDCLYLALAIDRGCSLVTGDERFANALGAGPYARHVRWIGLRK